MPSYDLVSVVTAEIGERTVNAVNARDLHAFLEVGRDFPTWIKGRIEEYGFVEEEDYSPVLGNRSDDLPGKPRIEYRLTLDMAKELAMVERTAKGREVRQYSIEVPFNREAFFNATVAAKPFGKAPKDWLKTDETQAYVLAVGRKILTEQNQLVIVVQGGPPEEQGTWLHPKLGMVFARWLDPYFALWCDEQIESILRRDISLTMQTRVHGLLRGLLRDIDKTQDAFVRQGLIRQARTLFDALGIPMPDLSLLGKPANQTQLEV